MKPIYLFFVLFVFASCATRYAHVPKVKVKGVKKTDVYTSTKNHVQMPTTIEQRKPAIATTNTIPQNEIHYIKGFPVLLKKAPPYKTGKQFTQVEIDSIPADTLKPKVYPNASQIKFGQKNLEEVLLGAFIAILYLLAVVLILVSISAGTLSGILLIFSLFVSKYFAGALLAGAVALVALFLFYLTTKGIKSFYKNVYKSFKFKVGNETYTCGDIKDFSDEAKAKRINHNMIIIAALTVLFAIVLLLIATPVELFTWLLLVPISLIFVWLAFKLFSS